MTKIIAEFCQNHNGNMSILADMVKKAALAGATHGKIQTIFANTVTYRPQFEEGLEIDGDIRSFKRPYEDEYDRLKKLELSYNEMEIFVDICKQYVIVPTTTCFTRGQVKDILKIGFESIKVASYDCASYQLIRDLKLNFKEIVVSTGATYDDEVIHTSKILNGVDFALLHCVTMYPTPLNEMHLSRMKWLKTLAPIVGFSDHTLVKKNGIIASKAALALGAEIIERHFTILDPEDTKDGPVSINPSQLESIVDFSKLPISDRVKKMNDDHPDWKSMIGIKRRELSNEELLNRDYYRGRFATPRKNSKDGSRMIFNWEETSL